MDSAIHRIGISETNCTIHWIVVYPVDSVLHLFNSRGLLHYIRGLESR